MNVKENNKSKKNIKGFLKAAFTGAIVAGSMRYLAISTASMAGLTDTNGMILTAVSVGVGLTALGMVSEYRKMRKKIEASEALDNLLSKQNLKKHGMRMLFNTASAGVGALSFIGVDFLLDNTATGLWIKDLAKDLFSSLWGDNNLTVNNEQVIHNSVPDIELKTTTEPVITESIVPEPTPMEPAPIKLTPLAELENIFLEQGDLGAKAMETLYKAQNNDASAIKDLAVYLFNGTNAMPPAMQHGFEGIAQNKEIAIQLYQQAADMGYAPAQNDLDYLEMRGWIATEPDIVKETIEPVYNTGQAIEELITAMDSQDLPPQAQKIYDGLLLNESWALESAGTGILNGSYGLPNLPDNVAIELIQKSAENGYEKAQIDLAYFQYHGLHGIETNQKEALKTIKELGRGWVGSESLLQPKDNLVDGDMVASCELFNESNKANCNIMNEQINAGQYVEIKNPDDTALRFYLDANAKPQETNNFVSRRIFDSLNLNANKL